MASEYWNKDECKRLFMGCRRYIKKRIPIRAIQAAVPFSVGSKEGVMTGKKGDWLMEGVEGEFYICDNLIFLKSYEPEE